MIAWRWLSVSERPSAVSVSRMASEYQSFPLGITDASVVALAERLNVTHIATLDHRHFHAVNPAHTPSLTLLP